MSPLCVNRCRLAVALLAVPLFRVVLLLFRPLLAVAVEWLLAGVAPTFEER